MARRTFQVIDVVEVLQPWHAGRPKTVVAASLGVDVKTVRKYVAAAEAAGIAAGDGLVCDRAGWALRVGQWFPELLDAQARSRTWPVLEARRALIASMVEVNTVATVHQRLRDEHGLRVSESSLRRYVARSFPERRAGAAVTVLRGDAPVGEAQIDYGYLGSWVDPVGGRVRRVQAFVVVLACSRHMFVRPVLGMDQASWTASHVAAWDYFAGVPVRLVSDNLKTGVVKADLYDPLVNRGYAEMAEHYGCLVDPARALKPKDEPRVERMVQYVRDSFWRGRSFASVADMQARALAWCTDVAGQRAHRGLDGARPLAVFEAVEAPGLLPLPGKRFEVARWVSPKVAPDCHVQVDKVLYSVPWTHIGARTDTKLTERVVAIHVGGVLVKTWPRVARGRCTDEADYPPEKIAFFSRNPVWCRTKAARVGPHVAELVAGLLAVQALHRLRAAQGIVALADRHPPSGSTPRVRRHWRPGTRPTARCAGSSLPAPRLPRAPLRASTPVPRRWAPRRICTEPTDCSPTCTTATATPAMARTRRPWAGRWGSERPGRRGTRRARPALLICDDFAMRELPQADDLYELVTERAGRSIIATSNRGPGPLVSAVPQPVVAESILDRLVNSAYHVPMPGRSYRPRHRPGLTTGRQSPA